MSRSGYSDDGEYVALWRRAVENAIAGRRGQAFLRDLVATLDAMPVKGLVANDFQRADGAFCTLGALGNARGIDLTGFDDRCGDVDHDKVGRAFNIAPSLTQEVMFVNDDDFAYNFRSREQETPEHRWERMRAWAVSNLANHSEAPHE